MSIGTEIASQLDLGNPSEELLTWAKNNIREDPNAKCQKLDELRDMIYFRGECTPHRTDDAFLLRFLRSRKFGLESAYQLFVNYHDFKEENSNFIENVGLECLEKAGKCDLITVPPYRDQAGRRMMLYKLGKWEPEFFTVEDVFRASLLILELAILEEKAQIHGGVCIVDCENISMNHVLHLTPNIARKIVQLSATSFPLRVEGMHFINHSWICDIFFSIFKPFLHDRMREKIFFHGNDMESLHKHVDPKCLPEIYGGIQPQYDYQEWIEGFRKDKTIVKELKSLGYRMDD